MNQDRIELEEALLKFFRNAKDETKERIFENLLFGLPFDTLKDMYQSEVL